MKINDLQQGSLVQFHKSPLHMPEKPDWTEDTESLSPDSWTDSEPAWKAPERVLDEERLLVLDGDLVPADDLPLFAID